MSLLEELKERRDRAEKRAIHHQEKLTASWQDVHECDKAIAALSPSEALLDHQPEAASPEFASDQDKALQSKLDQFLQQPFALLWGGGVEAPPGLDPHHLVEVVTRGNVLRTRAVKEFQWLSGHAPTNPEDDIIAYRPLATWDEVIQHHVHAHQHEPKPGDLDRAAAKLEDDPLAATMLQEAMDSGHADGPRIPDAERTSDESQAEDPTIDAITAHIENQPGVSSQASSTEAARKAELEEANRGEIIRKIAAANAYHEVRFGDRWRVGSELENQPGVSDEGTPVLDAGPPSIRRSDIPEGVAVETFTDAGVETVKIGGLTHIVEEAAETIAEAAYAPVNEDEGLMWSNGFEADAKAKAEPEQDKRPFWMFGKKELA